LLVQTACRPRADQQQASRLGARSPVGLRLAIVNWCARLPEELDVEEILGSSSRAFISDQFAKAQEWHRHVSDACLDAPAPRLVKCDAVNLGKDVDATGRKAHLIDRAGAAQVLNPEAMHVNWSTEPAEAAQHALRVDRVRTNPHVEVACEPRGAVGGKGERSDQEKLHAFLDQGREEVEEVLVQRRRGQADSRDRITRPGISARV